MLYGFICSCGFQLVVRIADMSKYKTAIPKWCKSTPNKLKKNQEIILAKRVRHFSEIPGPEALPIIGNIFRFIPGIAQFASDNTEKMLQQLHEKYGDIVRFEGIPFKRPIVFLFSPLLAREMYEKEGEWPIREALDSLKHYSDIKGRHVLSTRTPIKYIDCSIKRLQNQSRISNNSSMLEWLLQHMNEEEAAAVIRREIIPGAIDSVANTVGSALYAIANQPRVQAKLFAELRVALPNVDSPFTAEIYRNVPYLKACVKETLRTFPPVQGNTRTMDRDIDLGGFTIPKGVSVFSAHAIMGQRSEQFPEPQKFIPERWLKDYNKRLTNKAHHAYAFLPFGKGPRTCVARYLAVREMAIFMARIVRTFELQWRYEPLQFQHHLISTVQSPVKIKIVDR